MLRQQQSHDGQEESVVDKADLTPQRPSQEESCHISEHNPEDEKKRLRSELNPVEAEM